MISRENAVSPVIGVLLMLTLTLIIAAIVNSYAGGLMETETKAPSATLQAKYYIEKGIEIQHISGDPLPTSSLKVIIKPSENMGKNAGQFFSIVGKEYIKNAIKTQSWADGITAIKPGEIAYIFPDDIELIIAGIEETKKINNVANNVGNTFFIEIYYKNTMISRNEVLIQS